MPINPTIAMGVQPFQLADPLAQYGKIAQIQGAQNQNALAQYQLGAAQREEKVQNALSQAYQTAFNPETGTYDVNKLRGALISAGIGSKLPDIEKGLSALATQRLAQQKAESELVDTKLKQSRQLLDSINPADPNAPQQYIAWHEANHRDPVLGPMLAARGITAEASRARIQDALARGPQAFADLLDESKLGVEKFAEMNKPHFTTQDLNGTTRIVAIPGRGGVATVVPGSVAAKTLTPGEARTAAQEGKTVAHTSTDEAGNVTLFNKFGQVITSTTGTGEAVPIKGKPSATFEKTKNQREQLQKDLGTTIAELKDITKDGGLIDQSTGSGLGRARDVTAGFFGQATEGAVAAAKLKPIADLALKMVPRFEGPQSDKDTQSYKEAAGQLADSSLPSKIRKEAGKTVVRLMENRKGQFVTEGMAAEGTGAAGGSIQDQADAIIRGGK